MRLVNVPDRREAGLFGGTYAVVPCCFCTAIACVFIPWGVK